MRKTLFIIAALMINYLNAQPVLQEANFMNLGFSANMYFANAVSPGPSGTNQTWNFSSITPTFVGVMQMVNPSATPCSSLYPTSNYVWAMPGSKYRYHNRTTSSIEIISNDLPSTCSPNAPYTDPMQVFQFPFNYLQSYSDPFQQGPTTGTAVVTYDAYGTLTTPFGTYSNVARIYYGSNYTWVTTGNPSYIVMMSFSGNTVLYSNPTVSGINDLNKEVSVALFPNPSSGKFNIQTENLQGYASVTVTNLMGEKIYTNNFYDRVNEEIDINGQPKGVYFITIRAGDYFSTRKLVLE